MRSRRNFPRNRSRTKLGATHSCSRAASATSRASAALTLLSGALAVVAIAAIYPVGPRESRLGKGIARRQRLRRCCYPLRKARVGTHHFCSSNPKAAVAVGLLGELLGIHMPMEPTPGRKHQQPVYRAVRCAVRPNPVAGVFARTRVGGTQIGDEARRRDQPPPP